MTNLEKYNQVFMEHFRNQCRGIAGIKIQKLC
mgnify:CR=1 FL=1